MIKYFDELRTAPTRALQCYQILLGLAHERKTITYGQLAGIIGFEGPTALARILGHIMFWCSDNNLPHLTVLVVNQTTGLPGDGLSRSSDLNADREKVFNFNWYNLLPPSVDELETAYKDNKL
jgi:alkylated DNA nucleotide flippase Atl1